MQWKKQNINVYMWKEGSGKKAFLPCSQLKNNFEIESGTIWIFHRVEMWGCYLDDLQWLMNSLHMS